MADEFEAKLGHVKLNGAGIIEIWKSRGMQDALQDVVDEKVDYANSIFALGNTVPNVPPYAGGVDVADRTSIGYVTTRTKLGRIDQHKHNTLDAINH